MTSGFDAVAIGYRNVNNLSVSRLSVTSLEIVRVGVSDPYPAFVVQHSLDPLTAGIDVAPAINGYQLVTVHLADAGSRLFLRLKCASAAP